MIVKASSFDLQVITHFLEFKMITKPLSLIELMDKKNFGVKLGTYRMSKTLFISPLGRTIFTVPFPLEPSHLQTSFYLFLKNNWHDLETFYSL
jgi:hypothetical protein